LIRLIDLAWPLGLVMTLIVLSATIPRYFVEGCLGERALGIFGAIGYLGLAGIMAVGALGESATARLAEYYSSKQTSAFCVLLLKLCGFAVVIGCAGVVVALVAGGPILTVLYGPEYAAHADILVWTMIAAGISYVVWFVNHSVTAVRYFRSQLPLHLLAAGITAGACWWLVPHYGLTGAAVALSITGVAQLVGAGLVISHALWTQAKFASG
jgi:O-antigen/teichoic acid export membrane protein